MKELKLFLVAVIAFALCGFFGSVARAEIVPLGKIGGDVFVYDSATVVNNENITGVWVITSSKAYNFSKSKKFGIFGVHVLLDCVGHTYAIDWLQIWQKDGALIWSNQIKDVHFSEAHSGSIPKVLLNRACGITG